MFWDSINRAWRETWEFLGGWTAFWAVFPVPVTGFALHWSIQGMPQVLPEFQIWAIYGLAALGVNVCLIFGWNLACAPYRIERDKRRALEDAMGPAGGPDSILGAFRGRASYSLGEIARLLTASADHRDLVLTDLKKAVVSRRLEPIIEKNSWEAINLRLARSSFGNNGPDDLSKDIKIGREQLRDFLPKAGYGLPQWLEDKQA